MSGVEVLPGLGNGYVLLANACFEVARAVSPPAHAPTQTFFVLLVAGLAGGGRSKGADGAAKTNWARAVSKLPVTYMGAQAVPRRNAPV
jgi:hypothetical protein